MQILKLPSFLVLYVKLEHHSVYSVTLGMTPLSSISSSLNFSVSLMWIGVFRGASIDPLTPSFTSNTSSSLKSPMPSNWPGIRVWRRSGCWVRGVCLRWRRHWGSQCQGTHLFSDLVLPVRGHPWLRSLCFSILRSDSGVGWRQVRDTWCGSRCRTPVWHLASGHNTILQTVRTVHLVECAHRECVAGCARVDFETQCVLAVKLGVFYVQYGVRLVPRLVDGMEALLTASHIIQLLDIIFVRVLWCSLLWHGIERLFFRRGLRLFCCWRCCGSWDCRWRPCWPWWPFDWHIRAQWFILPHITHFWPNAGHSRLSWRRPQLLQGLLRWRASTWVGEDRLVICREPAVSAS